MNPQKDRYICANCGYVYDPLAGDPMNAIVPGTPFVELPDQWVCPMCYAIKEQFDLLD
jgi:rubredoxin